MKKPPKNLDDKGSQNIIKDIYRPEIDGLRAFAVFVVIINHFNKDILPSGYLGVDIFFVISGYVITSSLSIKNSKNFKEFISSFLERRIKRLIPALIPFTIITGILICLFNPNPGQSLKTGITSLFGLSNLYLLHISTDYFASSTLLNAFTHTWSLDVEEQFYIAFPLLIWFTGFGKNARHSYRNLFIASLFLISLSLISYIYIHQIDQSSAYFLMPTRFWEMSAGCICFLIIEKKYILLSNLSKLNSIIIFILLILVLGLPVSASLYATILVVLLTSILILCLKKGDKIFELLINEFSIHIGRISYSLYLWHWTVLCISRWTIGINIITAPIQIALIYFLSLYSYKFIELPFRNNNWSLKRWKTILKGILALIFTATTLFVLGKPLTGRLYLGKIRENLINNNNWRYDIESATNEINGKKCNADINYSDEEITNLFENCIIINPRNNQNRKIGYLGDSHILAMMSAQKEIYNIGSDIIHYSYSGCPFPYPEFGLKPKGCDEFLKKATNNILEILNKGDFIVINNYHLSHLGDEKLRDTRHNIFDENQNLPTNGYKKLEIYSKSLVDFSEKANSKGIKVILIGSAMRNNLLATSTKEWFRPFPSTPSKKIYEQERNNAEKLNDKFRILTKNIGNLFFIDPLEEIQCCRDDNEYNRYYRDTDHLSEYGSEVITKKLVLIISSNI